MKKILLSLIIPFVASFAGFLLILNTTLVKINFYNSIAYVILIILSTTLSFFIAYRFYHSYKYTENPEEFYFTLTFFIFGYIFLTNYLQFLNLSFLNEEIFDIFEHTNLFLGSLIILVLMIFTTDNKREKIFDLRKQIFTGLIAGLIAYQVFILDTPPITEYLLEKINLIIILTSIVFVLDIIILFIKSKDEHLHYIIASLMILTTTGILPFFYDEWSLLWWYFHLLILIAYTIIIFDLIKNPHYKLKPSLTNN